MSAQAFRRAVPPRELAATITARAVLRAGWAVAAVYLGISMASVVDVGIERHYGTGILLSAAALVVAGAALALLAWRPSWRTGIAFLAICTSAALVYDFGLLTVDPGLNDSGLYLVNRMTIVLLLIGAVSSRLIHGVWWCTAGCVLGMVATAGVQLSLGLAVRPGFGPVVTLAVYLTIIVLFVLIRRSQRKFDPDFSAMETEAARMAGQREWESQSIALLHDTVLNDLMVIAHAHDKVDERVRARFVRDIAAVSSAPRDASAVSADGSRLTSDGFREALLDVITDFQWRGLSVDISGGDGIPHSLAPHSGEALVAAVGGCLENVARHSGSDVAEVFIDASKDELSIMIVDHGNGFDPTAIPESSLGIRKSLITRIEGCGGTVRLWSAPGSGTSVVITVPLEVEGD